MADVEKGSVEANRPPRTTAAAPVSRIANPGPLGLLSFASTTFILSLYNVSARNVHTPNAVVGMALGCGGLAQFLAGMWEFPRGNTFGATAFTSYGAFWFSYAGLLIPGTGISSAYATEDEFNQAIGIYLMTWFTVTSIFLIAALRKNIGFIALLFFLALTFLLLGVNSFTGNAKVLTAGGALGIITALIAFYIGLSDMLAAEAVAVATLPIGVFKHD